jgi:hypothetical protein
MTGSATTTTAASITATAVTPKPRKRNGKRSGKGNDRAAVVAAAVRAALGADAGKKKKKKNKPLKCNTQDKEFESFTHKVREIIKRPSSCGIQENYYHTLKRNIGDFVANVPALMDYHVVRQSERLESKEAAAKKKVEDGAKYSDAEKFRNAKHLQAMTNARTAVDKTIRPDYARMANNAGTIRLQNMTRARNATKAGVSTAELARLAQALQLKHNTRHRSTWATQLNRGATQTDLNAATKGWGLMRTPPPKAATPPKGTPPKEASPKPSVTINPLFALRGDSASGPVGEKVPRPILKHATPISRNTLANALAEVTAGLDGEWGSDKIKHKPNSSNWQPTIRAIGNQQLVKVAGGSSRRKK